MLEYKLIPYSKQTISTMDAIKVGWQVRFKALTQGDKIKEFENLIAKYVGAKFAVAVSSGTAGLHLAQLALENPIGSKVATSPISFVASANSIIYAGLIPVFIDIDLSTGNISLDKLDEAINELDIKTIVPVHYAGAPCDMKYIFNKVSTKNINIIEDAAHGLGGRYSSGEKIGSCVYSDMTVFSFHPVKSITTGEGGIITTNSELYYKKLLKLRTHGIHREEFELKNKTLGFTNRVANPWYYEMSLLGYHYRITDIQATLGCSQMKKIDKFIKNRKKIANSYDILTASMKNLKPIQFKNRNLSANHLYPILIDFEKMNISRSELMNELKKSGIGSQVHYIPIPLHPYYQELGYNMLDLPNALSFYFKVLSIPIYPNLRTYQQKKVIKKLNELIS